MKIIRSIIVREGKENQKSKFIMRNKGQLSFRYAALMDLYSDIQAFLLEKKGRTVK